MKFTERLLVMCCVTGTFIHLFFKENPFAFEAIAFVGIAAFYLLCTFFVVQDGPVFRKQTYTGTHWPEVLLAAGTGIGFAYCAAFILLNHLYEASPYDLLENCLILMLLLGIGNFLMFRKTGKMIYKRLWIRNAIFMVAVGVDAVLCICKLVPNPAFFHR